MNQTTHDNIHLTLSQLWKIDDKTRQAVALLVFEARSMVEDFKALVPIRSSGLCQDLASARTSKPTDAAALRVLETIFSAVYGNTCYPFELVSALSDTSGNTAARRWYNAMSNGWLLDANKCASASHRVNFLVSLSLFKAPMLRDTVAFVGIGVEAALASLSPEYYDALADACGGMIGMVDEALEAGERALLDGMPCEGVHAYEVAEEFGRQWVKQRIAAVLS